MNKSIQYILCLDFISILLCSPFNIMFYSKHTLWLIYTSVILSFSLMTSGFSKYNSMIWHIKIHKTICCNYNTFPDFYLTNNGCINTYSNIIFNFRTTYFYFYAVPYIQVHLEIVYSK